MSDIIRTFLLMEHKKRFYDPDHDGEQDQLNNPDADEQKTSDSQKLDVVNSLDDDTETSS
jgi:hypothetical protein